MPVARAIDIDEIGIGPTFCCKGRMKGFRDRSDFCDAQRPGEVGVALDFLAEVFQDLFGGQVFAVGSISAQLSDCRNTAIRAASDRKVRPFQFLRLFRFVRLFLI